MSIIFDALKKVEKSQSDGSSAPPPGNGKSSLLKVVVLAVVVFIGIFAGKMLFSALAPQIRSIMSSVKGASAEKIVSAGKMSAKTKTSASPLQNMLGKSSKPAASKQAARKPSSAYELNGVFTSGDQVFALVNNEVVREGDTIQDAQVIKISIDEVTLRLKDKTITLRSNAQ